MEATPEIIIPDDLAGCRALIEQLVFTVAAQTSANEALRREKQELEAAYAELVQRAFRQRSERYLDDPNQLRLDLGGTADASDAAEGLAQAVEEAGSRYCCRRPFPMWMRTIRSLSGHTRY